MFIVLDKYIFTQLLVILLGGFRRFYRAVMSADGKLEEDVSEAAISDEVEECMENLKQEEAKQNPALTRLKNKLLRMLSE